MHAGEQYTVDMNTHAMVLHNHITVLNRFSSGKYTVEGGRDSWCCFMQLN